MIVSMNKKYTLDGEEFTVLTATKPGHLPVLGYTRSGTAYQFQADGTSVYGGDKLVEVSPYADFVIDEPVMVRDADNHRWNKRNFAGVNNKGLPLAWDDGKTRWTSREITSTWSQCRRPTAEELAT